MVIMNPTTRIKKIILETRHPALATPLNPNMPAIIESTKKTIANIMSNVNILLLLMFI